MLLTVHRNKDNRLYRQIRMLANSKVWHELCGSSRLTFQLTILKWTVQNLEGRSRSRPHILSKDTKEPNCS